MARFAVLYEITYSAPDAITIQQPTGGGARSVNFLKLRAYSSDVATIQIERDGAAATATTQTIVPLAPKSAPATTAVCKAFHGSDVGAGTVTDKINLNNSWIDYDLSDYHFGPVLADGANKSNITFKITSSATPTVRLQIIWSEEKL